jgi:tRNA dimethylallyltransferase
MDIGTAKPTPEEQRRVPHHLIDVINPDEKFSAAEYAKRATEAIYEILRRRKKPIVVGGSGLYIKALSQGLFEGPGANTKIRKRLEREAEELGKLHLYQRLKTIDPTAAKKIHPNDLKKIIRALEVYELTRKTISELHQKGTYPLPEVEFVKAGLVLGRKELYRGIDERVDRMFALGFVEEVKGLINMGYSLELVALDTLGYKDILSYLEGEIDLNEATERMKQSTRNYAKRQLTWFRKDKEINWFDANDKDLIKKIISHLE